jgi:molybdopterin molybdotransferase
MNTKNIKQSTAIDFDNALVIIINSARPLGTERVSIDDNRTLNRILAEDITSDIDIPALNKSLRDGFACRRADLMNELSIIETIPAGSMPKKAVGKNQCAKIMTGAVVPNGADCVIMLEDTESITENTIRFTAGITNDNIRFRGEDAGKTDVVLRAGCKIKATHIAVLASFGYTNPLVSLQPSVGIIATGSELIKPEQKPSACQIRNSNGFQLAAQTAQIGALVKNYGIAADAEQVINQIIKKALDENDVVISSGGVSTGEYDLVQKALENNNVKILFDKIDVNPGRPMVFGVTEKAFYFGLPGNPVSAFITFELLVKPFLYQLMGHDFKPVITNIQLENTITKKDAKRDTWLPVRLTKKGKATNINYHGSGYINVLSQADGLLFILEKVL